MAITLDDLAETFSKSFSEVDPNVSDYCLGFIKYLANDAWESEAADVAVDFLTQFLLDYGFPEDVITNWRRSLIDKLNEYMELQASSKSRQSGNKAIRLGRTIELSAIPQYSSTLGIINDRVDLEAVNGRRMESKVDKQKLEKAEAKIKAKLDKRIMKANYEASRLLQATTNSGNTYDEFYMKINPLQLNGPVEKNKDIRIEAIDLSFGSLRILSDATLSLTHGRRYGLIGNNGVGKSTLLRAISRRELDIPNHITILHVEQEVVGDDTSALQSVLDAQVWRKYLLKEEEKILNRLNEIVSELDVSSKDNESIDHSLLRRLEREKDDLDGQLLDVQRKLTELESDKAESTAATILAGLGFSQADQQRATKTFSGGYRMRIALARALFCTPDLLLLDEPSNMLDVPSIAFLSNYLQHYKNTVLVVSHDRSFLNEIATNIIHQHNERLDYYKGNFDQFYATREERKLHQKQEYENQMEYRKHLQAFIDKFRYNAAKASEAQSRIKKLEKLPKLEPPDVDEKTVFKFPEVEKISPPVLRADEVSFGYSDDKLILKDVSIDVQLDSRIGVIGPNGAGKSTMLKLLIEQLKPRSGLISRHSRLRIAYFAQYHVDALDLNDSALGFIMKKFPGKKEEEYRQKLGNFGLSGPLALQRIETLSGGQKSRLAFACLGMQNPHILILDEPTNHLDMLAMDALVDAIKRFEGGVILVSHDISFLEATCTSLWLCEGGSIHHFPSSVKEYKKRCLQEQGIATL